MKRMNGNHIGIVNEQLCILDKFSPSTQPAGAKISNGNIKFYSRNIDLNNRFSSRNIDLKKRIDKIINNSAPLTTEKIELSPSPMGEPPIKEFDDKLLFNSELNSATCRIAGAMATHLMREAVLKKINPTSRVKNMAEFLSTPLGEGLLSISFGVMLRGWIGEELRVAGMAEIGESLFVELIDVIAEEIEVDEGSEANVTQL